MKREGEKKTDREQTDGWGRGEEKERRGRTQKREPEKGWDDWLAAAGQEGTSPGTVHKAGTLWAEGNARSLVEAAPLACQRRH